MKTTIERKRSQQRVRDLGGLWYVPNPRLRTKSAAERAIEIANQIAANGTPDPQPDDTELFIALHTCAYQVARARYGVNPSPSRRRTWLRRGRLIREFIVTENLGLAYTMISRFRTRDLDRDDLISEAMFAMARAVNRFNPWRGFRFSTYACNVIARSLMRRGRIEARHRQLFPVQGDGYFDRQERPDEGVGIFAERLHNAIQKNLGDLTAMESRVLANRFPTDRAAQQTFRQIGRSVGLSKERVRQIQNAALSKLRVVLRSDPLLA